MKSKSIIIFFALAIMPAMSLVAQTAVVSGGGDVTNNGASLNYTIGQVAATYATEASASLNEGVQQTYTIYEDNTEEHKLLPVEVTVFPNPTKNDVTVRLSSQIGDVSYRLFDVHGSVLRKGHFSGIEKNIEMQSLAEGTYLLQLDNGDMRNSYRIVKTR